MKNKMRTSMKNRYKHTGTLLALTIALASTSLHGQTPSGALDPSFGTGGKVTTDFGGTIDYVRAVVVQPDGKLVAAGQSNVHGRTDFALARFFTNGTLDPSFGTGGKVVTDFAGSDDGVMGVALQADGKIVAGGWAVVNNVSSSLTSVGRSNFALARYNSNGTLDTTFGTGGKITTAVGNYHAQGVAVGIEPDGKIVLAGSAIGADFGWDFAVARYNSNGTLDSSFGTNGTVTTFFGTDPFFSYAFAGSLAIQRDGKIIVAGFAQFDNYEFALARYNSDGTLDPTFGKGGRVDTAFSDYDGAFAVTLQPDGKIVAAGWSNFDFGLVRYNSDGTLDGSFGAGGNVITDFAGTRDLAFAVAVRPDGKIVAAGQTQVGYTYDIAVARYNSNGTLDPSFATGGKATTDFAGMTDQAFSVTIQPDGKAVAAGDATVNGNTKFALARYQ